MSRGTPLDRAIESSMRRAKQNLSVLTKVQSDYIIVLKQLQERPSSSRLKMQMSGLESKALKLAKSLSQDFQGCKSHADFPAVFREFTEKLKLLQQDLHEASVRQKLKKLTPDEIDFPSISESNQKDIPLSDCHIEKVIEEEQKTLVIESDQRNPFRQTSEQKMVFKPLVKDSKKRKNEQVNAIARDVNSIAQTFEELNELVYDQQIGLEDIEENTNSAKQSIEVAKRDILKASKYQNNMVYTIGGTVLGGLVGGPVGAVALGLKAGIGFGIGASVVGGIFGRKKGNLANKKIDSELREPWNPQESYTELSGSRSPKDIIISEQL